jgi:hypothetical protein
LYKNIQNKDVRILVGLDIETQMLKILTDVDLKIKQHSSIQASKEDFYNLLTKIFSESDYFEQENSREAFEIYYRKIKNGTLEVRKTQDPCHAKLYIFSYSTEKSENGSTTGTLITGSSNLTYNGLKGQSEINVRLRDKDEYEEALKIFDGLWQDAAILASKETIQEFEGKVIQKIWYNKLPNPYLMYVRSLYEYFYIDVSQDIKLPHDITDEKFSNLKYQEFAIRQALQIIDKHNGVIVADVVGLGKSIVASCIANNLNLRTIVVVPPHLLPAWQDYVSDFGFNGRVFSRGKIEDALNYYNQNYKENRQFLIIIDEAHNYRNEDTKDYAMLHELCQGNKVVLLSATPFNNRPSDIY